MTSNAGDLIDETAGSVVRTLIQNIYQLVPLEYVVVVLQAFTVEDGAELDLEGELAVIN